MLQTHFMVAMLNLLKNKFIGMNYWEIVQHPLGQPWRKEPLQGENPEIILGNGSCFLAVWKPYIRDGF